MSATTADPRKTFGEAITDLAAHDDRVVVLSADSGTSSGFGRFQVEHADRYYEFGIQEHGVTGVAAGLASTGFIPVFAAIATFVTARNFEAFRNDLGYMRQNVKIVGRNGGMTYSELGPTHYSLEDFAITRMIPGVVVLAPQDPGEIRGAVRAMLAHDGPVYMRVGGPPIRHLFPAAPFEIGRGSLLRTGDRATVVSTGTITAEALEAVDALQAKGIGVELIGMPTVQPLDASLIRSSATRTGHVITVEEHYVRGGLSAAVAEATADLPIRRAAIGLPHEHITTGTYDGLLHRYELDAVGLTARISVLIDGWASYDEQNT
ncbi:transketolase family protein [Streptomyces shenzhenensis]|uniref:transketolase family protein n=1 Tax=Streptomyces shenzhenensis TaxID=943815 RepID=UPI0033C218BE